MLLGLVFNKLDRTNRGQLEQIKTKEQLATELSKDFNSIRDIQCPRGVANAGLYFGFIRGYQALEDEFKKLKEKVQPLLDKIADQEERIKSMWDYIKLLERDMTRLSKSYNFDQAHIRDLKLALLKAIEQRNNEIAFFEDYEYFAKKEQLDSEIETALKGKINDLQIY